MPHNTPSLEGIQRTIPANRTLYEADDSATEAFYIHDGLVKIHASSWIGLHRGDNEQRTGRLLDVAGPRDVIGVHHRTHPHTAVTAVETFVTIIPREHFNHPANAHAIIDHYARNGARHEARLQNNDLPVPVRLLELLKDLARRFGDSNNPHVSFSLPLTHTDLADLVNSTRVTISRVMNELQREGVLEGAKGHYKLDISAAEPYITNLIFTG